MKRTLRVLHIEDSEPDVALLTRHLKRADYELISERVETPAAMKAALEKQEWDVILCDYSMPHFNALQALRLLQELKLDIPFIIISGTVGEDVAVKAMLSGAHDYLMKDNLVRLVPTVEREMLEAENRRARQRAEEALRESEDRYRDLVEHSHDLICTHDLKGRILSVNQAAIKLLGYDPNALLQKNIRDLLFSEVREQFEGYIAELLENGIAQGLMSVQTRAGERRVWEYNNTLRTEGVAAPIVRGMARDITEQKHAEAELRESEERYKGLIDSTFEGVVIHQNRIILNVNRAYAEMFGYEVEELIGLNVLELTPPEYRDLVSSKIKRNKSLYETIGLRKDGTHINIEVSATDCMYNGGRARLAAARDITERKLAESQLRFQKSLLESQTEAALDAILVVSMQGEILYFNKQFVELWNVPEQVLDSHSDKAALEYALDQLPDPQEFLSRVEYLYEHPVEESHDEILLKDGRTLDRYSAPIKSGENEYYGRVWFFRDITKRKQAEEQLRRQLDFTEAITTSLGEGVYALDERGRVTFMNPAAEASLGWTMGELLEQEMHEVIHFQKADGAPRLEEECPLLEVIRSGQTLQVEDDVFTRKDGTIFPISYTSSPIITNGQVVGAVLAFHDITERKRAEEELRKSEERYRDLVENAHDIIYSHDMEGNYTSINKAGEQITGYTRQEALRMNLQQIVAPEYLEKAREMMTRKLAGEKVTAYELEIIAKDGRRVALEVNTKLVMQDGVATGVQGIARDITDRQQLEDQLRQAQKMEAVGRLAGGVAHDFNNLLTAITGYSDLSLMKLKREDPLRHNIKEIKRAGERAAGLTRQLLAFSRKQVLQPKVLDVNTVVSEMEKMLHRLIGEDINVITILAPGLGNIKADPGQIEQVILNLVVNARDAMPQGGDLTIETANVSLDDEYARHHIAVEPGPYVMLAVSDNGCGMDEETRARIFEPFFTTKEQGKGTGLGLSTVYGIVKQSKGNIWVYSEVGQGTTFKVYLPQVEEGIEKAEQGQESRLSRQCHETVLLVEDDEIVRGIARMSLEMNGYQVLTATSAREALLICEQAKEPIHLMLTDVVMPGMSGPVLAEQIRKLHQQLTVLFMSGYTQDAIVNHGVLREGVNFVEKPFTPDALARKVREVLDATHTGGS